MTKTEPDNQSLRSFAEGIRRGKAGKGTGVERLLPPDIVEQLRAEALDPNGIGARIAHHWLSTLGYDLTQPQVDYFFTKIRAQDPIAYQATSDAE